MEGGLEYKLDDQRLYPLMKDKNYWRRNLLLVSAWAPKLREIEASFLARRVDSQLERAMHNDLLEDGKDS